MHGVDPDPSGTPSLLGITVRRAFVAGRFFFLYATAMSTLIAVALALSRGSAFSSAAPLLLPIFGVVGSQGGLAVFLDDRLKGVLEYLLAYGLSPRRLFFSVLSATLLLESIVLVIAVGVGLGTYVARGHAISPSLALALGLYGLPMSYASAAFATTAGMYWTSLSSPRMGMSSPMGVAPLVGMLPSVVTLLVITGVGVIGGLTTGTLILIAGVAVLTTVAIVVLLVGSVDQLLRRERLLSPA